MGIEVQILVCMGGFSVYEKLNRSIRFASNQCVEEGDLAVFFRFMGKLDVSSGLRLIKMIGELLTDQLTDSPIEKQ